jgi:hypothetical protein
MQAFGERRARAVNPTYNNRNNERLFTVLLSIQQKRHWRKSDFDEFTTIPGKVQAFSLRADQPIHLRLYISSRCSSRVP